MKYFIRIFILFIVLKCSAQNDSILIVFPLKHNEIDFNLKVRRMLKYNDITIDSAKKYIINSTYKYLNKYFKTYSIIPIRNIKEFSYLTDSLILFNQWNYIHSTKIDKSRGIKKLIYLNDNQSRNKYFGHTLDNKNKDELTKLVSQYNIRYILFINKFETRNRNPFSKTVKLCLHIEIYNSNINKIYGDKSNLMIDVSRIMFYNVFQLYFKNEINEYYNYIRNKKMN